MPGVIMPVTVVAAEYAGACYGVQRALNMAEETIKQAVPITSLGPLIHNPIVVAKYEQAGIAIADSVEDIHTDAVLVRSHGITPRLKEQIERKGLSVVDATCPYVLRAQKAAQRLANEHDMLVIVGEKGHPEVEALEAYGLLSSASVIVVSSAKELPDELPDTVGVVVQTTQTFDALDDVLAGIRERGSEADVAHTICRATRQRQEAASSLAKRVDAMVVIGGRNSANTTRLAEICSSQGARTFHIESWEELDPDWFADCEAIGVTAGASTPQYQIDEVTEELRRL